MHLTHLCLRNFRNLTQVEFVPNERFNVLAGDNGQGKTNFLASIYWLATLRPLRGHRLRGLVRWGESTTHVAGRVDVGGLEHRLTVQIEEGSRRALREGKLVKAATYFGTLAVVTFTPDDVGLIRGAPSERRKFLDRAVFTGQATHLSAVLTFRRALDARNRLLRSGASDDELEAFEGVLAAAGAKLVHARQSYVAEWAPRFSATFSAITRTGPTAVLHYRTAEGGADPVAMAEIWRVDRVRDRARGFTQRGPQTDDLVIRLADRVARGHASQGQQRAMVLALKIAEIEVLAERYSIRPVLLLDDVSSELDASRNAGLFSFLEAFEGQVFTTTTDAEFLKIKGKKSVFSVEAGVISRQEG